jgi:hypothetical protein
MGYRDVLHEISAQRASDSALLSLYEYLVDANLPGTLVGCVMTKNRALLLAFGAAAHVLLGPSSAAASSEALSSPEGQVLLQVTGAIGVTNSEGRAVFDREMLMALPSIEIKTSTVWTDGVQSFVGVPLKTLLDFLQSEGGSVTARAVNDYSAEFPVEELEDDAPIIAYLVNGQAMPLREKGPLWIVYPYDSAPRYRTETVYARSVWHLFELAVRD